MRPILSLCLCGVLMGVSAPMAVAHDVSDAADGEALFVGAVPLQARLRHQDLTLPPVATRCTNCHRAKGANDALGPVLNRRFLLELQARHGGPPVAYDQAAFCRVVRTGIAPSEIVIAQAMPQFDINDEQCARLWRYLIEPSAPAPGRP